jgi:predicted NUDIX family phosphoesterase
LSGEQSSIRSSLLAPAPKGFAVSTVATERVLVVPTALFHILGYFQGFSTEVARYLPRLLEGDQIEYLPRGRMEEDPSFKQLIPYVLFRWTDERGTIHVFQYQRGGGMGEARLHAKYSVGVGGHISSDDVENSIAVNGNTADPSTARKGGAINDPPHAHHIYRSGMQRELVEEVAIDTAYDETVVGLINDDETPVGRVHLGVVHLCDVAQPLVAPREPDVLNARFEPVSDILTRLDQFETWSQIAVRALFG